MDNNSALKSGEADRLHLQHSKQLAVDKRERHLLTDREGAIIACIGLGLSNKEIARELGVTPETIKSHLKRIFRKLSASTRAQAVFRAQGMVLNLKRNRIDVRG